MTPICKSPDEIEAIARTGDLLRAEMLRQLKIARVDTTLGELRMATESALQQAGCRWDPLPSPISLAINQRILSFDENDTILKPGDLLSIDLSASLHGWWADMARSTAIGTPELDRALLIRQSRQVQKLARDHLARTQSFRELQNCLQESLANEKVAIVPIAWLHGIGRELHESPVLTPFDNEDDAEIPFEPGLVFTLEPVLSLGPTICERDLQQHVSVSGNNLAAFFEDTFAVTESGIRCLTTPDVSPDERNFVLIGMPGAGKSTIGRELARLTNRPFIDLDERIERTEGNTLSALIAEHGFDHFLEIEANAAHRLDASGSVISPGGSLVYRADAIEVLRSRGTLIYLDVPLEELQRRLSDLHQRGVVIDREKSLSDLFLEREPLYEANYDFKVSASDASPAQIAEEIIAHLALA